MEHTFDYAKEERERERMAAICVYGLAMVMVDKLNNQTYLGGKMVENRLVRLSQ